MTSRPRSRRDAIEKACVGSYAGTADIVEAVVKDSTHVEAWRPVRATAIMAMAEPPPGHVWMSAEEFDAWVKRIPRAQRGLIHSSVGITPSRRSAIQKGASVTKAEAMAAAHFALGLPLPIPASDTDAFVAWAHPRFGAVRTLAGAMGLAESYITDRMRGYDVTGHGRAARPPDAGLIRAMDWCWRVGPFSPYGDRIPAPAFPSQAVAP